MKISCCVIVDNDNRFDELKRCLGSVIDYVDEIILVANGNPVKKIQNIDSYFVNGNKINYFYHPWNKSFADQRNFAASKVSRDADFFMWIDSDDILVGGEYLHDIALNAKKANLHTVFFDYWYFCTFNGEPSFNNIKDIKLTQKRERLIKPNTIMWHKRVHETPSPLEGIDYKYTDVKFSDETPIVWLHLGVTDDMSIEAQQKKSDRNMELLELELADERKTKEGADPRTLLYLMKIYAVMPDREHKEECIKLGEEYLTKSGWDAERAICCTLVAKCLGDLGNLKEAKDFLFRSIQEYPYDPILYLHLSRVCYDLGQFQEMKHWLQIALSLDSSKSTSAITNIGEMKALSSELMVKYYFNGEKNIHKAYQAAKLLYKEAPTIENKENLEYLEKINDLDTASEEAHKLMLYYEKLNHSKGILGVVSSMPQDMAKLPFAWHMYNKHKEPRVWKENEICYYASFGQPHFEQWGPDNLAQGIGGSETAVIRLSQEWAKSGYTVVVYCDCGKQEGMHDGVLYLPYFKFNPKDSFNIFINWRSNHLAGRIKAKKFYIDLHDLFAGEMVQDYDKYDKLFVKSEYQRSLASVVPNGKVSIISNGI